MFDWALQNTLVAAVLLGVVAVCARFLRLRPAVLHCAWLLVVVRLIVPPLPWPPFAGGAGGGAVEALSFWVGNESTGDSPRNPPRNPPQNPLQGNAPVRRGDPSGSETAPTSEGKAREMPESTFIFASGTAASPAPAPLGAIEFLRGERFAPWRAAALWVWLFGAALVLAREVRGTLRVRRLVRGARPAGAETLRRARAVAREMGVALPRLGTIPGLRAPFVWSLARPVLLLDAAGDSPPRSVLAHELAHIRRRDHWTAWLELVALCLHWWNPVLHFARARMRRAMELACDAWVVRRYPGERLVYARALVDAAAGGGHVVLPRALGALGPTGRAFEERLTQILHADAEARMPRLATVLLALLAVPAAADWAAALDTPEVARTDPGIAAMLEGFGVKSWRELELRSRAEIADPKRTEPSEQGESYKNLGLALLARGAWAEGARSFRAQIERGFQPENARYNLACAHARRGDPDAAFALLQGLTERGGLNVEGVLRDPDLRSLAADPRWGALTTPRPEGVVDPGEEPAGP